MHLAGEVWRPATTSHVRHRVCEVLCSLSGLASSPACLASSPTAGVALGGEIVMRGGPWKAAFCSPAGWRDQRVRRAGRRRGAGPLCATWGSLPGLVGPTALLSAITFPTGPFSPSAKVSHLGRDSKTEPRWVMASASLSSALFSVCSQFSIM